MVGERGGHQPAEKVRGDVARDIGGEGRRGLRPRAMLAQIGERQSERRGHAEALRDAQSR